MVRFALHEGSQAHLGPASDGWRQITLADGKRGWVREEAIEDVVLR